MTDLKEISNKYKVLLHVGCQKGSIFSMKLALKLTEIRQRKVKLMKVC